MNTNNKNKSPTHYEIMEHVDELFGGESLYTTQPIVEATTVGSIGTNMAAKPKKTQFKDEDEDNIEENYSMEYLEDVIDIIESCETEDEVDDLLEEIDPGVIGILEAYFDTESVFVEFIDSLNSIESEEELEEVLESLDEDELDLVESYCNAESEEENSEINEFVEVLESIDSEEELDRLIESLDEDEVEILESYYNDLDVLEEEQEFLDTANSIAEELEKEEEDE